MERLLVLFDSMDNENDLFLKLLAQGTLRDQKRKNAQSRADWGKKSVMDVWARTAADGSDRKSVATSQVFRTRLSRRDLI
jgi:hypothetical protein